VLGMVVPGRAGAEAIVGATLLAKGAGVPGVLALLVAAPLLNVWTFRRLTSNLSTKRAALLWTSVAGVATLVAPAAALLPGLQRI